MEFFIFTVLMLSAHAPAIQGKTRETLIIILYSWRRYTVSCTCSYAKAGSPVELQSSALIEISVGGILQLNCSSFSMYVIEFKEIGQTLTIEDKIAYEIEQEGNPRVRYSQEGCLYNDPPDTTCIKTLEMDIVESLHGKSFQCRARTREINPVMYYSEGTYLHGRL